MSGGSFNYFYLKDNISSDIEVIKEMCETLLSVIDNAEQHFTWEKKLTTAYTYLEKLVLLAELYKEYKEKLNPLLKDIEWACSGDISFKDINIEIEGKK